MSCKALHWRFARLRVAMLFVALGLIAAAIPSWSQEDPPADPKTTEQKAAEPKPEAKTADPRRFETTAKFAILVDSRSGRVFYDKGADELMPPASMSKIMTALMVFERLKDGRLKMDDEFLISEDAWRRGGAKSGGSTMYADVNSRVKLSDLIQGVIVQSANDACIAIAEGIAGSEEAFAHRMTQRARELGLPKSTFKNSTGLPDPEHRMTVRELALLTRYLIEVFPEYYKYYSQPEFTWNNISQKNRNPLLGSYPGADGVKTGYTKEAGYGLIGSAERSGRRLVVVIGGTATLQERSREAQKLLDWGFRQFRTYDLFPAGATVADGRVWGGQRSWVPLVARDDVKLMLTDDEKDLAISEVSYKGPLIAPVREGREVGSLRVTVKGKLVATMPIFTGANVEPTDAMWKKALDSLLFMTLGG